MNDKQSCENKFVTCLDLVSQILLFADFWKQNVSRLYIRCLMIYKQMIENNKNHETYFMNSPFSQDPTERLWPSPSRPVSYTTLT